MHQDPLPNLGHLLRSLRRARGWRIVDVSNMTGLAVSTISKVENGRMSLTYDKVMQLTQGLGVRLTELLESEPKENPRPAVTALRSLGRVESAHHINTAWYDYWFLNTDISSKDMTPIVVEAKARTMEEFGDLVRHPGQELVFVLEGKVTVHTEFYQPTTLEPGQSLYIDSNMGHAYLAAAEGRCRFLNVCSGSEAGFASALKPHHTPAQPQPVNKQPAVDSRRAAPTAAEKGATRGTRKTIRSSPKRSAGSRASRR